MTRATWVCCSIASESQTRYGSALPSANRHGRSRRATAYQASSRRRSAARRAAVTIGTAGYFTRLSTASQLTFLKKASTYLPRSKAL